MSFSYIFNIFDESKQQKWLFNYHIWLFYSFLCSNFFKNILKAIRLSPKDASIFQTYSVWTFFFRMPNTQSLVLVYPPGVPVPLIGKHGCKSAEHFGTKNFWRPRRLREGSFESSIFPLWCRKQCVAIILISGDILKNLRQLYISKKCRMKTIFLGDKCIVFTWSKVTKCLE